MNEINSSSHAPFGKYATASSKLFENLHKAVASLLQYIVVVRVLNYEWADPGSNPHSAMASNR